MSEAQGQDLPADLVQRLKRLRDWADVQARRRTEAAGNAPTPEARPVMVSSSVAMMVAIELINEFLGETQADASQ